jgi:hypothetical protein
VIEIEPVPYVFELEISSKVGTIGWKVVCAEAQHEVRNASPTICPLIDRNSKRGGEH